MQTQDSGAVARDGPQAGFTLVLVLVLLMLVSVPALMVSHRWFNASKRQQASSNLYQAGVNISKIRALITDPLAWNKTLYSAANTTFACIRDGTSCAGQAANAPPAGTFPAAPPGGSFKLYDRSGNIYYDSTVATAGFSHDGQVCNTYSTATPDNKCPFHVVLFWVPDTSCGAGVCNKYWVSGYTRYSAKAGTDFIHAFNPGGPQVSFGSWNSGTILKGSQICCSILCKHIVPGYAAGQEGQATVALPIGSYNNCYPGSPEVPNDVCDMSLGPIADWAPAGQGNYSVRDVADPTLCP